jgi:hypothetical protein
MNVTEAVKSSWQRNWDIGDALVAETDGSHADFKDVLRDLREQGIEGYTVRCLRELRDIALSFKPEERDPAISWQAYSIATCPEYLPEVVEILRTRPDMDPKILRQAVVRQRANKP